MFSTVSFYDFCERQNHCPKSKKYHFGNTGTERLSLNGNPRVNLHLSDNSCLYDIDYIIQSISPRTIQRKTSFTKIEPEGKGIMIILLSQLVECLQLKIRFFIFDKSLQNPWKRASKDISNVVFCPFVPKYPYISLFDFLNFRSFENLKN